MNSTAETKIHQKFIRKALTVAKNASKRGEVPVGAVLVKDGKILAKGHNLTRSKKDPTCHAEMVVLRRASKKMGNERLNGTALYVTLEPCAMCAGAMVQARIPFVIYGAKDPKAGACGSVLKVLPNKRLNHRPMVMGGIMAEESAKLLRAFFKSRRRGRMRH